MNQPTLSLQSLHNRTVDLALIAELNGHAAAAQALRYIALDMARIINNEVALSRDRS